jgi:hypothetical protein
VRTTAQASSAEYASSEELLSLRECVRSLDVSAHMEQSICPKLSMLAQTGCQLSLRKAAEDAETQPIHS